MYITDANLSKPYDFFPFMWDREKSYERIAMQVNNESALEKTYLFYFQLLHTCRSSSTFSLHHFL